jgi:signal transduction histidine kinase
LDAAVWAVSPKHDTLTSLLAYLCEFAAEHFSRTPIRCRVSTPDFLPSGPLPPHVRNHLFMATREALNNALKHSNASEVSLGFFYQTGRLKIEVADDGQGFDVAQAKEGTRQGLKNLEERMREIQGLSNVRSGPGGTRVQLLIPLED